MVTRRTCCPDPIGVIRFLCLAAILVSWGPTHVEAAVLVERLIRESSKEDQPLPTLHQLFDLLEALEPKLLRPGFVQEILGWNFCLPELGLSSKLKLNLPLVTPGIDEIKALVDSLQYCFRIGEQSVTYIESSMNSIPGAIAFVKWFLGKSPIVPRPDQSMIRNADFSDVSLKQSMVQCLFKVSLHHRFDNLHQLFAPQGPGFPTSPSFGSGTLDVRLWPKLRLESLDLPNALIGSILYCIVKYVIPKIVFSDTMHTVILGIEATDWPNLYRMHSKTSILSDEILLLEEGTCLEVLTKEHSEICVKNASSGETALNASEEYSYSNNCLRLEVEAFAADVLALSLLAVPHKLFTVFAFTSILGFPSTSVLKTS